MSFTDCEEMNQDFFTLVYCIQNKSNSNCAGFDIKKRAFQNDLYSNISLAVCGLRIVCNRANLTQSLLNLVVSYLSMKPNNSRTNFRVCKKKVMQSSQ